MRIFFLAILMLCIGQALNAQPMIAKEGIEEFQGVDDINSKPSILQRINVEQDDRLVRLLNWHIKKNKKVNGMKGYRVEIFFSSDMNARVKASRKKVEFLSKYPDETVHVRYIAPNFRVRVGDFRTENEAIKLHQKIKEYYPIAFVVPDIIEFPMLKPLHYE